MAGPGKLGRISSRAVEVILAATRKTPKIAHLVASMLACRRAYMHPIFSWAQIKMIKDNHLDFLDSHGNKMQHR